MRLVPLIVALTAMNGQAVDLPFDHSCSVFYDNDDHRDVYTDEYLLALAHLGDIRLMGITTTYAPNAREYELFVKGRAEIVDAARRSGLRHLPDATAGTSERLARPASNLPEDTRPLDLAASKALLAAARGATPEKPLVVITGGQLTVIADAWLLDHDIGSRVVVAGLFGVPGRDYNASLDAWAWTIVVSKFRVLAVPFGTSQRRGTVFMKAAEVPKARIRAKLPQDVPFFHWMSEKHHPSNGGPEEHDYDGQAAMALMRPDYITKVRRWRPDGILANGDAKLVPDENGPVYEAVDADQAIATSEFWRAMTLLAASLPKPALIQAPPAPLRVSDNHRFLVTADGKPFFWLADTAWQLIHDLTREEVDFYLKNRAAKGFNVIQTVALAEYGGLDRPNPYQHLPLHERDPARPDVREGDDYWKHVDYVIERAAQHGLYIALLPTWGSYVTRDYFDGKVNGIFTPANAESYGRFLGQRYRAASNIIWMLGGDRAAPTEEAKAVWRAMARGIAVGASGREDYSKVLMTFHPAGPGDSADYFHNDEWLDFNGIQSSHGPAIANWKMIERDYHRTPVKPVIDLETTYDEIVFGKQTTPLSGDLARRAAYWAVFAGASGHTYGHNSIWQMYAPGQHAMAGATTTWREALDAPSATQMGYLRTLIESRPFLTQEPDQSLLAEEPIGPLEHVAALRGDDYALIYTPTGKPLRVRLDKLTGKEVKAWWFDPRTGMFSNVGQFTKDDEHEFSPVGQPGVGNDWVLVLDARHTN